MPAPPHRVQAPAGGPGALRRDPPGDARPGAGPGARGSRRRWPVRVRPRSSGPGDAGDPPGDYLHARAVRSLRGAHDLVLDGVPVASIFAGGNYPAICHGDAGSPLVSGAQRGRRSRQRLDRPTARPAGQPLNDAAPRRIEPHDRPRPRAPFDGGAPRPSSAVSGGHAACCRPSARSAQSPGHRPCVGLEPCSRRSRRSARGARGAAGPGSSTTHGDRPRRRHGPVHRRLGTRAWVTWARWSATTRATGIGRGGR